MVKEQTKITEDMKLWIENARKVNAERLKETLKAKGMSPYLILVQGENSFTLLPVIPVERISSYGRTQGVFKIKQKTASAPHEGEEFDWPVTVNSPMYMKVVDLLENSPIGVTVIKLGSGKATRLDLKE